MFLAFIDLDSFCLIDTELEISCGTELQEPQNDVTGKEPQTTTREMKCCKTALLTNCSVLYPHFGSDGEIVLQIKKKRKKKKKKLTCYTGI